MPFSLTKMLARVFDTRYFEPDKAIDGQTAIPYVWVKGKSKLILVLGENAGGKSFFRRMVQCVVSKNHGPTDGQPVDECIHLSMQARTDTGLDMMPIARAMVYGDENYNATGVLTAHTIEGAISTATKRDHSVVIYWDEPDIGMAARSAAGAGVRIREFVDNLPAHIKAVVVTSHSPHLVAQLLKAKQAPHYIYLGDAQGPSTAQAWVTEQLDPNIVPRTPQQLSEDGHVRFRLIQKILDDKRKKT